MSAASSISRPPTSVRSPFDSPVLLWLLVAAGLFVLFPIGEFLAVVDARELRDTDDAMRLVQVRDLLAGQPWFDMSQHRLMAPAGADMHWSRYVDAPLAALIALGTPLFGPALAEGLVAALWPPALFAVYLTLVHRAVSARFGPRAAILALFAATQAGILGPLFAFGRIDHHNVQILALVGLGCCLADDGRSPRRAAVAGGLAAFSLAVGLETVPFLAVAGLVLLADWVRAGPPALPALAGFALALALASLVLFFGQTAPRLWLATACDALSPPWLWIAGCAAATVGGAALLSSRLTHALHRAGFVGLLGMATVVAFAMLFPGCVDGPFHDLPSIVRREWLDRVAEMLPFRTQLEQSPGPAFAHLGPVLVAGLVAGFAALRGPVANRRAALLVALFLFTGFALGLVQYRGVYMASAMVAFVAGPVLDRAVTLLGREVAGWRRPIAMVVALLMFAGVWVAPFSAVDRLSTPSQPAQARKIDLQECVSGSALAPLDALEPGAILAPIELGPFILLRTEHSVVAAPYHRAIPGLVAALTGLGGSEADLRHAIASSGAIYLVLCGIAPPPPTGELPPFVTGLARGEASAPWLDPVPSTSSPLLIWRIRSPFEP